MSRTISKKPELTKRTRKASIYRRWPTKLDVVGTICEVMDRLTRCPMHSSHRELITFVPDRPGHDFRYAIDFAKLNSELGWSPGYSFEQGLEATVTWYIENRAWWEPLISAHKAATRRGLSSVRV